MRRITITLYLTFLFSSCAVHSVHLPYTAKHPGTGGFEIGIGAGLERDVSNGFPTSDWGFHTSRTSTETTTPRWKDYAFPGGMVYVNAGLPGNFIISGYLALGFPIFPTSSLEVSLGVSRSFELVPIYMLTGVQPIFVRGRRSDRSLYYADSSQTYSVDVDYYIYGVKIPLLITISPVRAFELTLGAPLQLNYLDAYITGDISRREKKFDVVVELLVSVKINLWYFYIFPQFAFVNMEDFITSKRIWGYYPALMLGVDIPGR